MVWLDVTSAGQDTTISTSNVSSADLPAYRTRAQTNHHVTRLMVPAALVVLMGGTGTIVTLNVDHSVSTEHVTDKMHVVHRGVDIIHMEAASKYRYPSI